MESPSNPFAENWNCAKDAESGAEYSLIVPPSYYRAAMDGGQLKKHYVAVADKNPVTVLLCNYLGAVAGIDMDCDRVVRLAQHSTIVGTNSRAAIRAN